LFTATVLDYKRAWPFHPGIETPANEVLTPGPSVALTSSKLV